KDPLVALVLPYVEKQEHYETLSLPVTSLSTHNLSAMSTSSSSPIEMVSGRMQIKRLDRICIQFPLRVARAITAHKAQGATLRNVTIDLNAMFEVGHPYTMLSRAPGFADVTLTNASRQYSLTA